MTSAPPLGTDALPGGLFEDHTVLLDAVGAPWLWSTVLAGTLAGEDVTAVEVEAVGTGQVASCLRVRLTHGSDAAPRSVVVKTASSDPTSRATSAALRHGEIEVGFYANLAPEGAVRVPHCHLAALSAAGDDFLIVLEDLGDHVQADQIAGMSVGEAAAAIDELAALHATWWETTPNGAESFMADRGDPGAHAAILGMLHPGFEERFRDRLHPEVLEISRRLVAGAATYLGDRPGPMAVVHGDFRPDNLMVGPDRVAVVDWQTVNVGPALSDVAYFLGGALSAADRSSHEGDLLDRYRSGLAERGVAVDASTVTDGIRRCALDGLVMAIGASQVVGQTERGDEMFAVMAERSARHAQDCDTLALLP